MASITDKKEIFEILNSIPGFGKIISLTLIGLLPELGNLNQKQIASDIEESLFCLQTDYIDLYQIENFSFVPQVKSTDGIFSALEKLRTIVLHSSQNNK